MTSPLPHLGTHLRGALVLLARRPVQLSLAVSAIAVILSIILAPNTSPTTWEWIRIGLIGLLGGLGILVFASTQSIAAHEPEKPQRLIIAGVLLAVALVLNLTFTLGATILFSLGVTIVALLTMNERDTEAPWKITGALVALIPFWIWSALDAWTWLLVVLVPLAIIGIITDGHMRAASGLATDDPDALTARGHRLAAWMGILGSALITLALALVTDAADGVNALGAIGAIALVGLEAGAPTPRAEGSHRAVHLADAALLWIALCWIVSL